MTWRGAKGVIMPVTAFALHHLCFCLNPIRYSKFGKSRRHVVPKRLAAICNINTSVIFCGDVSKVSLHPWYILGSAPLFPSHHVEHHIACPQRARRPPPVANLLRRESPYLTLLSRDVVLTFGITSIVLTASLLLAIAYAAWNPVSRHHLGRVSFRLLVCALIAK